MNLYLTDRVSGQDLIPTLGELIAQKAASSLGELPATVSVSLALERKAPDKPIRPGQPTKREFEYIRHGTQTLIASFDVSRGKILHENIGQTSTEADFLAHRQQMVRVAPGVKKWHLVMDCLNTHQSESLVRSVVSIEGIPAFR